MAPQREEEARCEALGLGSCHQPWRVLATETHSHSIVSLGLLLPQQAVTTEWGAP